MLDFDLSSCEMCPHKCKVNRNCNQLGRCKASSKVKLALASLHYYEEPCISGENGSGTVFFSNCNMKCNFCQNYKISWEVKGIENSIRELPNDFIDLYLTDLKYFDDDIEIKYSGVKKYFENASNAIKEMYKQVGAPVLDDNGLIKKGLIIRHLVLPNNIQNSKKVLKWIKENIDSNVYVSIMAQYFPCYIAKQMEDLNRKLTNEEYEEIENYVYELNIENGYMQDLGEHEEEYVPDF